MIHRSIETFTIDWQGRTLSVTFEADWLGFVRDDYEMRTSHLEVRCIEPKDGRIPITETGYRSHFCHPDLIAESGGPEAFIRSWLEEASSTPEWKAYEASLRQPSLFDGL
ncbi:hypothetical protein [Marinicauda sp. Alg238-R41]|uniref:hypothetical protein n=1 Tax=Marinicauda sp. Alg238-R41 TaxID=2993447 RepID=UPI0022E92BC2|nr:hypothetical protein [Marinicauda sp. Alg238-R41]